MPTQTFNFAKNGERNPESATMIGVALALRNALQTPKRSLLYPVVAQFFNWKNIFVQGNGTSSRRQCRPQELLMLLRQRHPKQLTWRSRWVNWPVQILLVLMMSLSLSMSSPQSPTPRQGQKCSYRSCGYWHTRSSFGRNAKKLRKNLFGRSWRAS